MAGLKGMTKTAGKRSSGPRPQQRYAGHKQPDLPAMMQNAQVIKVDQGYGNRIWLHVRTEDGRKTICDVGGIHPYFYAEEKATEARDIMGVETGHRSISGQPLAKYTCTTPKAARELVSIFSDPHEGDIPYTQRFMTECPVNGKVRLPISDGPVTRINADQIELIEKGSIEGFTRQAWFDIETGPDAIDDVSGAPSPIYMVAYKEVDDWHLWYWHPYQELPVGFSVRLKTTGEIIHPILHGFVEEKPMLISYIDHLRVSSPDTLAGWYSGVFDMPYVINRAKRLHIKNTKFGHGYADSRGATIPGTQHIDLLDIHRKMSFSTLVSDSLKAVAKDVLDIELEKTPGNIEKWWHEDLESLAEYNIWDVEATWAVDAKRQYTDWALNYAFFAGVDNAMDVVQASVVIDALCLKYALGKYALPMKPRRKFTDNGGKKEKKFKGGAVKIPEIGIHNNVMVIDYSAMYPNIIIGANLSFETAVTKNEIEVAEEIGTDQKWITIPDVGHKFHTDFTGMMPAIMDDLFKLRSYYDKKYRETTDPAEKQYWYEMRKPIKDVMNAGFGILGYDGFRLYKVEVSESITAIGRLLGNKVQDHIESHFGYKVIYGDTDSCMILVPDRKKSTFKAIIDEANRFIREEAARIGLMYPDRLDLDFEKLYSRYLQGAVKDGTRGAKKKYAGTIVIEDWKDLPEPKMEIKGFEYKRSETAPVTASMQMEMFKRMLLEDQGPDEIVPYVNNLYCQVRDGKLPISECIFRPRLKKKFSDYKVNTEGLRAATYGIEWLGHKFRKGDRVYVVPVCDVPRPKGMPKTDIVGLPEGEELPAGFTPDWNAMADKAIKGKVEQLFDLIGATGASKSLGMSRLEDWF